MDDMKKCDGCGRPRSTCWKMPCLVLETALAIGMRAVKRWAGPGALVTRIAKGGRRVA